MAAMAKDAMDASMVRKAPSVLAAGGGGGGGGRVVTAEVVAVIPETATDIVEAASFNVCVQVPQAVSLVWIPDATAVPIEVAKLGNTALVSIEVASA